MVPVVLVARFFSVQALAANCTAAITPSTVQNNIVLPPVRRIFLNARCECVVEDKVFFPEVFADFFVVFLMQKLIKKNHRSIPGFEV